MDNDVTFITIFVLALLVGLAIFVAVAWRALYRVPAADEALVITGAGAHPTKEFRAKLEAERAAKAKLSTSNDPVAIEAARIVDPVELDPEFKIVVGKGVVLRPGQRMVRMSLASESAAISIANVPTVQGMTIGVDAVVIYKVGDNPSMIARSARRFSSNKGWTDMVKDVLEGHLRAVVGTMSLKDIWQNREQLASTVSEACGHDLSRLGLHIDSFGIKHIDDGSGYIDNIAAEEKATAERDAKIARANALRESAEAEARAQALTSEAEAASAIRQAEVRAEAERAAATAAQAGPLAEAKARQAVIEEETRNAALSAQLKEQELQATVYKEADAQKYRTVKEAQAARESAIERAEADAAATERAATADATATKLAAEAEAASTRVRAEAEQAQGEAEAAAERAKGLAAAEVVRQTGLAEAEVVLQTGLAEAQAIKAQGDALAANQEPMIRKALVDNLPLVVAANSEAYSRVGSLTVLDGMDGIGHGLGKTMASAMAFIPQVMGVMRGDDGADGGGWGVLPPSPTPGGGGGAPAGPGGSGSGDGAGTTLRAGTVAPGTSGTKRGGKPSSRKPSSSGAAGFDEALKRTRAGIDDAATQALTERARAAEAVAAKVATSGVAVLDDASASVDAALDAGSDAVERGFEVVDAGMDATEGLIDRAEQIADRVTGLRTRFTR
jgi:uncharacterized membrane protein YqiK